MMRLGFGLGCSAEGRATGNQCPYKEREKKKRVRECEQRVKVDGVYLNAFPYQRVTPSQEGNRAGSYIIALRPSPEVPAQ